MTLCRFAGATTLAIVLCACSSSPAIEPAPPEPGRAEIAAARQRIAAFEADPQQKDAGFIHKVQYQGRPAYLFISPCCDMFNYLYDADGRQLCAPSGGFAGFGDGTCKEVVQVGQGAPAPSRRKARPAD